MLKNRIHQAVKMAAAVVLLLTAVSGCFSDMTGQLNLARQYIDSGYYESAVFSCEKVLNQDAENETAIAYMQEAVHGWLHATFEDGQYDEAEQLNREYGYIFRELDALFEKTVMLESTDIINGIETYLCKVCGTVFFRET